MSQENVEAVRLAYRAFQAGELTDMLGFLDPNIEVIPVKEFPGRPVYHGRDGFLEFLGEWFEPSDEYSIELEDLIDAGDRVVTVERHVGLSKETGLEVAQRVSDIWTIREGALAVLTIFLDKREALEAAGLSE
jgi:ketosteroid isomerase-like protein